MIFHWISGDINPSSTAAAHWSEWALFWNLTFWQETKEHIFSRVRIRLWPWTKSYTGGNLFLLMDIMKKVISNDCHLSRNIRFRQKCLHFILVRTYSRLEFPVNFQTHYFFWSHVILAIFVVRHFHVRINWSFPGSCSNNLLHDTVVLASERGGMYPLRIMLVGYGITMALSHPLYDIYYVSTQCLNTDGVL